MNRILFMVLFLLTMADVGHAQDLSISAGEWQIVVTNEANLVFDGTTQSPPTETNTYNECRKSQSETDLYREVFRTIGCQVTDISGTDAEKLFGLTCLIDGADLNGHTVIKLAPDGNSYSKIQTLVTDLKPGVFTSIATSKAILLGSCE